MLRCSKSLSSFSRASVLRRPVQPVGRHTSVNTRSISCARFPRVRMTTCTSSRSSSSIHVSRSFPQRTIHIPSLRSQREVPLSAWSPPSRAYSSTSFNHDAFINSIPNPRCEWFLVFIAMVLRLSYRRATSRVADYGWVSDNVQRRRSQKKTDLLSLEQAKVVRGRDQQTIDETVDTYVLESFHATCQPFFFYTVFIASTAQKLQSLRSNRCPLATLKSTVCLQHSCSTDGALAMRHETQVCCCF